MPPVSQLRKNLLLAIFCTAQFLDAFGISSLFSAIPVITSAESMTASESVWLVSAYQLTFAAFLLVSGRISDLYDPKRQFILGVFSLGAFCIGIGFVRTKIVMFVLRAFAGVAAALTIPSAMNLLVHLFPDPLEQARAIGLFGGSGAIGTALGLVIGAIFVQFASWPWVFWFVSCITLPIAAVSIYLIPSISEEEEIKKGTTNRLRRVDIPGVSILTAALLLFIFAVTSGTTNGWQSARVLAPLIISIALVVLFFVWEARTSADNAALPPRIWFYPNFPVLFGTALLPHFWWTTVFVQFTGVWQQVYHMSPIVTALRLLPLGLIALPLMVISGRLVRMSDPKWLIFTGLLCLITGTILLPFVDRISRYWPLAFPGFCIGATGGVLVFVMTSVAIFRCTPPEMAGVVGAVFNSALQLGSAVGIAAVNSIQTSLDARDPNSFKGRAAALWFVLAVLIVEAISVLVFYKSSAKGSPAPATIAELVDDDVEKPGVVIDGGKGGGAVFGGMTVVDAETGKPPSTRTTTRRLTLELADVELEVHGVQPRRRTIELVDMDVMDGGGVQPRRRTIEVVDMDVLEGGVQGATAVAARRRTIEIGEGRRVSYGSDRSDERHGERESNHSHSRHGHGHGHAVQRVSAVLQITGPGVGEVVPERGGTP